MVENLACPLCSFVVLLVQTSGSFRLEDLNHEDLQTALQTEPADLQTDPAGLQIDLVDLPFDLVDLQFDLVDLRFVLAGKMLDSVLPLPSAFVAECLTFYHPSASDTSSIAVHTAGTALYSDDLHNKNH